MGRSQILAFSVVLAALNLGGPAVAQNPTETAFRPEWGPPNRGIIPDAETAVKVAVAVLSARSPESKREVEQRMPWWAQLGADGNWEVRGTLPKLSIGGTTVVVIARRDGRIITIYGEQ